MCSSSSCARAEQVLSKDEILAGVWDFDFDGDPNIVEVYVAACAARSTNRSAATRSTTVRGAGYRIATMADRRRVDRGRRTASIRFRVTALATVSVLAVLIVTAIALVLHQRRVLTESVDEALELEVVDITREISARLHRRRSRSTVSSTTTVWRRFSTGTPCSPPPPT